MNLDDIQAVIDSAKSRGGAHLEQHIREQIPEATEEEVLETADLAVEIIESVPVLLARASQAARRKGLAPVVDPLLEHASRYFLQPVDLMPEMTQGLAGLLDDTYLIFRMLENLEKGPEKLVDWNLDEPLRFLARLLPLKMSRQLDALALLAMQEVENYLSDLWTRMGHPA